MVATGAQPGHISENSKHLLGVLAPWRFPAVVLAVVILCLADAAEEQRPPSWRITADGAVVHANAVSLLGMTFGDVMAKPVMNGGDLVFQNLSASGYGGRLTGQVELRGARPATGDRAVYAGRLAIEGVDFNAYLRSLGLGADIGGTLSGKVAFSVPEGRIDDLEGEGEFLILGANLIQLPWLANLLVGDPTNRRDNDRAQVRFELGPDKRDGKGRIRILAAKVETPAVNVVASGVVDFDWQLDLRLRASPDGGMLKEIDLLRWTFGPVLRPLFGNILQYRMRGRMTEPVLILQPFSE